MSSIVFSHAPQSAIGRTTDTEGGKNLNDKTFGINVS